MEDTLKGLENIVSSTALENVSQWLKYDKAAATVAETDKMVVEVLKNDEAALTEFESRFGSRISFGTAGLRAAMKSGSAMMNELVVVQTSQGLCEYIKSQRENYDFSVVIGYDGRYNSKSFALRTAAVFLQKGCKVFLFGGIVPTPFVAYAVTQFKSAAGIMVTASHNPKQDNGYKVYWDNGAQITSPHDKGIAASILQTLEPWENVWTESFVTEHGNCSDPLTDVHTSYMSDLMSLPIKCDRPTVPIKITYTAMHGVGYNFCKAAFKAAGFEPLEPVKAQVEPDPDFPTVEYPNPEEGKGALTLAFETAEACGSTLILANDPDADRLAVAVKSDGEWRIFNGNEIGSLFGWWVWTNYSKSGAPADRGCMLSSTVSSFILKTMADAEGFYFEDTLTGFKWMGNRARELQKKGYSVMMSFEEAIGFAIGDRVVDKDGVSAAVVMAAMANQLATSGKTLVDQLDTIYGTYGYHASYGSYYICHEQSTIDEIFGAMRKDGQYPSTIAGEKVIRVRDLTTGYDNGTSDNKATLPQQSSNMITFWFESKIIFTLRTSGTEPKIKFYSEIQAKADTNEARLEVQKTLQTKIRNVAETLLQPKKYNLQPKKE